MGLVSEHDVVTHLALGAHPDDVTAGEAMTPDLVMVGPSDSFLDAAARIHEAEVRYLPGLSEGALVGFVSMRDLLGVLLHTGRRAAAAG